MRRRAALLTGLAVTVSAAALAACGGDEASSPEPDLATVERLALSTRPLSDSCPKGTEVVGARAFSPDDPPVADGSRVIQCVNPGSAVFYSVYKDEETREEAVKHHALVFGESRSS